jgi:acetyltransferase
VAVSYPSEFDKEIVINGGQRLRIRPIRPEDAPALVEMGRLSTREDLRLRFFSAIRPQIGPLSTLLTQIDYDRQFAVVAYDPDLPGPDVNILGVVRLICAPDNEHGDFAIMVRSDFKGRGLGFRLMQEMLDWAEKRGLKRVEGDVLPENRTMLRMVRACGGVIAPLGRDFQTVHVAFDLPRANVSRPSSAGET